MVIPRMIILIVFSLNIDNFRVRVITLGLVSAAQYLVQFGLLITTRAGGVRQSKPILLAAYGMIIVLFVLRAVYMIIHPDGITDPFDPMWINSATPVRHHLEYRSDRLWCFTHAL